MTVLQHTKRVCASINGMDMASRPRAMGRSSGMAMVSQPKGEAGECVIRKCLGE